MLRQFLGACLVTLHNLKKLWKVEPEQKVFNDPIHGHMEVHPLLIRIIDTPQFQRLRNIKQLGGTYFVFPGPFHNRFEHSIGFAALLCADRIDQNNLGARLDMASQEQPLDTSLSVWDCSQWGVDEMCQFLQREDLQQWEGTFRDKKVTGPAAVYITAADLEKMGIESLHDCLRILNSLRKLWLVSKVFNDPIHGHIALHPLLIRIIDTPQFQRLRNIKQLGGTYFVFPGASHNRFEHSIGVGYLAGRLVEDLKKQQPELQISQRDILCVQIAGLCHDLGHGPFSHMFDNMFIPKARPDIKWKHEDASVEMFDYLVTVNELEPVMEKHGLVLSEDLNFIKEQIAGPRGSDQSDKWPYKGRPKDKSFLYEIVANKRNGIDVDKWDYFARDCYHLGIKSNFDHDRFLRFARVCEVDGHKTICTRDKEVENLYDMFMMRNCLHRRAYQHRVGNIIEIMITEAFLKADPHIKIEGSEGKMFTLSTAIDDMEAYTKVTDHIFEQILNSSSKELAEAKEILSNITLRRHYKCLGKTNPDKSKPVAEVVGRNLEEREAITRNWKEELAELCKEYNQDVSLKPEDFEIDVITMDFGMKDKNPIDNVHFYYKDNPTKTRHISKDEVAGFRPEHFAEELIRVYCRKREKEILEVANKAFVQWCEKMNFSKPQDANWMNNRQGEDPEQ